MRQDLTLHHAEAEVRKAFAQADARIAILKARQQTASNETTISGLIADIADHISDDAAEVVGAIEADLNQAIKSADRTLDAVSNRSAQIRQAVAFLKGDPSAITMVRDADLRNFALSAKSSLDAGAIDGRAEIQSIEHALSQIAMRETDLRSKFLPAAKSSAKIVRNKAVAVAFDKTNPETAATFQKLADRQALRHRKAFGVQEGRKNV